MKELSNIYSALLLLLLFCAPKTMGQITQQQSSTFLNDSVVATGHIGISIYEPATGKYLYNYNADKNFIPSSNVKLFSLYAGLKYLKDSLIGLRYVENDTALFVYPSGDPTLLHVDFKSQPILSFLTGIPKHIFINDAFKSKGYGSGWAWSDYQDYYMAERSALPVYGNTVAFMLKRNRFETVPPASSSFTFLQNFADSNIETTVQRNFFSNSFITVQNSKSNETVFTPFITSAKLSAKLLADTVHKKIDILGMNAMPDVKSKNIKIFYSRPVDSLFKPMMFNSDNFFAEQTLLMVSNEKLGYMSDEEIIDTLLKNDFKDIPTKPRWVDGCGLSRYNLFSPKNFIYLLDKLQKEFGLDRMKRILPTAGQGSLRGYYENAAGSIYAKTGSMSNNVSLSGYLYTKQNKLLLFSVMINNYSGGGRAGRKAIERFIQDVRNTN